VANFLRSGEDNLEKKKQKSIVLDIKGLEEKVYRF